MFIFNSSPHNHVTLELHDMLTYCIEKEQANFETPEEQYFVMHENLLDILDNHEFF